MESMANTPVSFEVEADTLTSIDQLTKILAVRSRTKVIKRALEEFDLTSLANRKCKKVQLSIRLSDAAKKNLDAHCKTTNQSRAGVLRSAVQALIERNSPHNTTKHSKQSTKNSSERTVTDPNKISFFDVSTGQVGSGDEIVHFFQNGEKSFALTKAQMNAVKEFLRLNSNSQASVNSDRGTTADYDNLDQI
jgi:predicted transcriptional regulator